MTSTLRRGDGVEVERTVDEGRRIEQIDSDGPEDVFVGVRENGRVEEDALAINGFLGGRADGVFIPVWPPPTTFIAF